MNCSGLEVEYAAYIGLDWGSEKHAIAVKTPGSHEIDKSDLNQTPEDLHDWIRKLRNKFEGRTVAIAIEQTKGAVIHALLGYEFVHVFRINPKSLADYRKAFSPSGAKDDPTDADYLLEWVELHRDRIRPWAPDDAQTRALQKLVEFRREVINHRVALTNQLTQTLKEYFPQALDWGGEIDSLMMLDFLSKWPTLEKIKKARPDTLRTFYRQHGSRSIERIEERLEGIGTSQALTKDSAVIAVSVCIVQTIIRSMHAILESINDIDKEIAERFNTHPDRAIFDSFPGAGPVIAPRLLAAMGSDRSRFESADEVQRYSGIAPVTERSGKHTWVHRRFACPKFLKQSFHEFAAQSRKSCPWARAYYEMKRNKGLRHHASVRALAYKWIRIIYRCWQERILYDETAYLRSLERKGSPLLSFMKRAA